MSNLHLYLAGLRNKEHYSPWNVSSYMSNLHLYLVGLSSMQLTGSCPNFCLQSLPVAFGIDTAKWICVGSIDVTQLSVAGECFTFLIKEVYTFPCVISDCQVLSLLCIGLLTCRIIFCRWFSKKLQDGQLSQICSAEVDGEVWKWPSCEFL